MGAGFSGSFEWGGQQPAPMINTNSMVALLDAQLTPTWGRNIADPNVGAAISAFEANSTGATRAGAISYIAAFDARGGVSWLRNLTTSGVALTHGLTVANDESTYVVGGQFADVDYGDGLVPVVDGHDGFIVKLDPSGLSPGGAWPLELAARTSSRPQFTRERRHHCRHVQLVRPRLNAVHLVVFASPPGVRFFL